MEGETGVGWPPGQAAAFRLTNTGDHGIIKKGWEEMEKILKRGETETEQKRALKWERQRRLFEQA